ncbi:MAG: hypothetical protein M0Z64_06990 [Nitrospiraceae bacterium]|nr:hypothetical protein [Nitrospiraceae bacterium]
MYNLATPSVKVIKNWTTFIFLLLLLVAGCAFKDTIKEGATGNIPYSNLLLEKVTFYEYAKITKEGASEKLTFTDERNDKLAQQLKAIFFNEFIDKFEGRRIDTGSSETVRIRVNMSYEAEESEISSARIIRCQLLMFIPRELMKGEINNAFIVDKENGILELRQAAGARIVLPKITVGDYVLEKRLVKALAQHFADVISEQFSAKTEKK